MSEPYLTGVLMYAGDLPLHEDGKLRVFPGVLVNMQREDLAAAPSLPMYQQVAVVPVSEIAGLRAALARVMADQKDALEYAKYWYKSAETERARVAELERLERANASLIASNTTLRAQRNKARAELKLRNDDISRQWAVNAALKGEIARLEEPCAPASAMAGVGGGQEPVRSGSRFVDPARVLGAAEAWMEDVTMVDEEDRTDDEGYALALWDEVRRLRAERVKPNR